MHNHERIDITSPSEILGDLTYNMQTLEAPVLNGYLLKVFQTVLTMTPFGGIIRRNLLNQNGVTKLRELSSQMSSEIPLSHPMRRLNRTEREAYDDTVLLAHELNADLDSIIPFVNQNTLQSSVLADSIVLKMHLSFKREETTPLLVAKKTLSEIERLQPTYRMFSAAAHSEEILAAAAQSTKRYADKKPLSIFDGIPIAFKDMIPIAGYVMTHGSAYYRKLNEVANEDDLLVRRFREIGAIILPPTTMTEGGVTPVGFCVEIQG